VNKETTGQRNECRKELRNGKHNSKNQGRWPNGHVGGEKKGQQNIADRGQPPDQGKGPDVSSQQKPRAREMHEGALGARKETDDPWN